MALSRLRLRLAGGFALVFGTGLFLLAAGSLTYLWRESNRRLDVHLAGVIDGVTAGLERELKETPDSAASFAAREVLAEWPSTEHGFAVIDKAGVVLAALDRDGALTSVREAWQRSVINGPFSLERDGSDYRASGRTVRIDVAPPRPAVELRILAFRSTEGIEEDTRLLAGTFAVAAPLIVLLSLIAGYLMARRALRPVDRLGEAIHAMTPTDLSRRLTIAIPADEVDAVAIEFNALLQRLDEAQRRNRRFVREAAHQIRTPLTLVLGEAAHALDGGKRDPAELASALARVRLAAEQMRRRVDELFLLAEAEAGEQMRLEDDVELDGLALECTDLMRGRATALGRTLALGEVQPVTVRGNAPLLREALLELLENGCRHGGAAVPVTTEVRSDGNAAVVEVTTINPSEAAPGEIGRGLGSSIVTWIAEGHGGRFEVAHDDGIYRARLRLPITTSSH